LPVVPFTRWPVKNGILHPVLPPTENQNS